MTTEDFLPLLILGINVLAGALGMPLTAFIKERLNVESYQALFLSLAVAVVLALGGAYLDGAVTGANAVDAFTSALFPILSAMGVTYSAVKQHEQNQG